MTGLNLFFCVYVLASNEFERSAVLCALYLILLLYAELSQTVRTRARGYGLPVRATKNRTVIKRNML